MKEVLLGIGQKLKSIRKLNSLTLKDVAQEANVSTALVSKVENGRTVPSLPVLLSLLNALNEEPGNFFRGINLARDKPYLLLRREEHAPIAKDTEGFTHQLILGKWLFSVGFEVLLLQIEPGAAQSMTRTDAFEFRYMLSGTCTCVIGEDRLNLEEGDALYFDGRMPHKAESPGDQPVRILLIRFYLEQTGQ